MGETLTGGLGEALALSMFHIRIIVFERKEKRKKKKEKKE